MFPFAAHLIMTDYVDYINLLREIDLGQSKEFSSPATVYQICREREEKNVSLKEHYYHLVAGNQRSNIFVDEMHPSHHEITQVIRGNKGFEVLWNVLIKNSKLQMVWDSIDMDFDHTRRLVDYHRMLTLERLENKAFFDYTIPGMYVSFGRLPF